MVLVIEVYFLSKISTESTKKTNA